MLARRCRIGIVSLVAAFGLTTAARAEELHKYFFMFFSNPSPGKESQYLNWYTGQHIHDLLNIDGIEAAQFFRVADAQFRSTPSQRYMMIWEIDTTDLNAAFDRVRRGLSTGTTVTKGSGIDQSSVASMTYHPITQRVTHEEVVGKTPAEVQSLALSGLPAERAH